MTKVAVITGSSSGIGAAVAVRLARKFDVIILHARHSKDALQRVSDTIQTIGAKTELVLGDLTDVDVPKRIVGEAVKYGQIDCLIANAGFPILKTLEEGSENDLEYAFKGNVMSFFALMREALPLLQKAKSPKVVAVGSFTSHVFRTDIRQFPMSAASKGALETAVKSFALSVAPRGITVNCVVPGMIEKDTGTADAMPDEELRSNIARIPLLRIGMPDEVAGAIEFLTSPDSSYITGQIIHVNGGLAI